RALPVAASGGGSGLAQALGRLDRLGGAHICRRCVGHRTLPLGSAGADAVRTTLGSERYLQQTQQDMDKMGSHTGRYASVCALFYEKTGDQAFKEKSFRSFNWATYMAHEDGLITEAMAEDNFWYSDDYGDYIRQFLASMGSMPEWAPPKEDHLLYSSSVVTKVSYGTHELRYSTFDGDATETLRLAFAPTRVTAGGI